MTLLSGTSRFVPREGVKLHHLDWGRDDRHPVVLVHGSRLHAHVWNHFSRRFCDRYHIVAVDQRGHGDSGWAGEGKYQLEDFCQDLEAVVEARGLPRFTLIGHSLGGRVSMLYTHRYPERVERLILVDITPGRSAEPAAAPVATVARQEDPALREFDSHESATAYLARLMSRAPRHLVEESVRHGLRETTAGRYTWKYDPALLRRRPSGGDLWEVVKSLPTPTLLQYGSHSDVVNAELAARMSATMPNCAVERVEDAGHGLFTDQPEVFAESVERFLQPARGS